MSPRAQARFLPDGQRLHLSDGPIDIVLQAFGSQVEVEAVYRAAVARFGTVLDELCSELPALREQARAGKRFPSGVIARRMFSAVLPFAKETFITPMAAVAGAVAEELLTAMTTSGNLRRVYVNNGGDIALHIGIGEHFLVGMIDRPDHPSLFGKISLDSNQPVRGIATSGWRGRSFSLGIADAVTVLAKTASMADAAATMVANAVDLPGHPAISRTPASEISPDSDLRNILVTTFVGELTPEEVDRALSLGEACAQRLAASGLIHAAALRLQGQNRITASDEFDHAAASYLDRSLTHA